VLPTLSVARAPRAIGIRVDGGSIRGIFTLLRP
jgi:hypothetical protein